MKVGDIVWDIQYERFCRIVRFIPDYVILESLNRVVGYRRMKSSLMSLRDFNLSHSQEEIQDLIQKRKGTVELGKTKKQYVDELIEAWNTMPSVPTDAFKEFAKSFNSLYKATNKASTSLSLIAENTKKMVKECPYKFTESKSPYMFSGEAIHIPFPPREVLVESINIDNSAYLTTARYSVGADDYDWLRSLIPGTKVTSDYGVGRVAEVRQNISDSFYFGQPKLITIDFEVCYENPTPFNIQGEHTSMLKSLKFYKAKEPEVPEVPNTKERIFSFDE